MINEKKISINYNLLIVGVIALMLLVFRNIWDDLPEVYGTIFYAVLISILLIVVFRKFRQDANNGTFSYARQGVSIVFIGGTIIYMVIQECV